MDKILILGNVAGGKSTLADRLGAVTGIPVFCMDRYLWKDVGVRASKLDIETKVHRILELDRWIIDGSPAVGGDTYGIDVADSIVFIDLPILIHIWRIIQREMDGIIRIIQGYAAWTSHPRTLFQLAHLVKEFHAHERPRCLDLAKNHRTQARFFHLRSSREVRRFLKSIQENNLSLPGGGGGNEVQSVIPS